MKSHVRCVVTLLIMLLVYFSIVSASDTITTFQTGPFNVNIDLGAPCSDIDIHEPYSDERISGTTYTEYVTRLCNCVIDLMRVDGVSADLNDSLYARAIGESVRSELLTTGADKDTIEVYSRVIDGKPGAVGSAYVTNIKYPMMLYVAKFFTSPNTICIVSVWDNETRMVSAIKTINVTEVD